MATFCRPGITDYRNPNLADAMRVMGFVQRFGIGIQTARMELKQNGNPDLKITNRGTWSSTPCDYTGDRPPGDIPGRSGTEGFVRAKKARTF
jgi:hypothetical protein